MGAAGTLNSSKRSIALASMPGSSAHPRHRQHDSVREKEGKKHEPESTVSEIESDCQIQRHGTRRMLISSTWSKTNIIFSAVNSPEQAYTVCEISCERNAVKEPRARGLITERVTQAQRHTHTCALSSCLR
eukprot:1608059-Rhodomonas_salina.1